MVTVSKVVKISVLREIDPFLRSYHILHTGLLLGCSKFGGYEPLDSDKTNTLRSRLSKLKLLIDEVSMVGSNTLLEVHKRL